MRHIITLIIEENTKIVSARIAARFGQLNWAMRKLHTELQTEAKNVAEKHGLDDHESKHAVPLDCTGDHA